MAKYTNLLILAVALSGVMALISCDDDPDEEYLYVLKTEYASDFIKNREKFSEFAE